MAPTSFSTSRDGRVDPDLVGNVDGDRRDTVELDRRDVRTDDPAPLVDQREADLPPDPLGRSGDEGHLVVQPVKLHALTAP